MRTHIVTIPPATDGRVVQRWAKVVTGVDANKKGGYAFDGEFVGPEEAAEVASGAVILIVDRRKQVWDKRRQQWIYRSIARLCKVSEEGQLEEVASAQGNTWALKLRDKALELLDQKQVAWQRLLAECDDEVLVAELVRRGYTVTKPTPPGSTPGKCSDAMSGHWCVC